MAKLNVVLDGNTLELELDSPAMNLVGFEHAASSDADKAKVSAVHQQLEQPLPVRPSQAADCKENSRNWKARCSVTPRKPTTMTTNTRMATSTATSAPTTS